MIWFFASVVLFLAVADAGFRLFVLWLGVGVAGLALALAIFGAFR